MSCILPRVFQGARGLRIRIQFMERNAAGALVPIDLSPAATLPGFVQGQFRKPSGLIVSVPFVVDSPTADGFASYFTATGFLDEAGRWEVQGLAFLAGEPLPGRGFFPSDIGSFEVEPLLAPYWIATTIEPPTIELGLELPGPLLA